MLRLLHIVVLAALVLAAADVYKIKYESTLQAERVAKLRAAERTGAAPIGGDLAHLLPRLPPLADVMRGR